jgi:hypothetical protein
MARNGKDDVRPRQEEAERYRLAAEEALNQLDWVREPPLPHPQGPHRVGDREEPLGHSAASEAIARQSMSG